MHGVTVPILNPTQARLRLLRHVQRHEVYQHPDGTSFIAGARQVTSRIAHLEGAGWVRLEAGSDYDVRYWCLTGDGERVLEGHQ